MTHSEVKSDIANQDMFEMDGYFKRVSGNVKIKKKDFINIGYWIYMKICCRDSLPRWLSWMRRPTGDQEVAGSTPAEVGNILSWRLIMKYFLRSFSLPLIQEGQLSVSGERMCTILVNRLED